MRELRKYAEPVLRMACIIMAAIVVYQLAEMILRWNPFRGVTVPALPTLTASTNAPAGNGPTPRPIVSAVANGTNGVPHGSGTNITAMVAANTNVVVKKSATVETNAAIVATVKVDGTDSLAKAGIQEKGTNLLAVAGPAGTNSISEPKHKRRIASSGPPGMGGMSFNPFQSPGGHAVALSPAMQARVSHIVDSEILGPVMHPLPMALLGIAGDVAFLRSDSGQTGLVKEGDSLDDLKVVRIGINRVLVEQNGQKKELTIFSGYGSDSLLPNEDSHENDHP